MDLLKTEDLGRAGLLLAGAGAGSGDDRVDWPSLPDGAVYAVDVVETPADIAGATRRLLRKIALVPDLPAARTWSTGCRT